MKRHLGFWLAAGWAAVLVLPWHIGGVWPVFWPGGPQNGPSAGDGMPALIQGLLLGRPWLLASVLPLLAALAGLRATGGAKGGADGRARSAWLTAAGAGGLGWLLVESLAVTQPGLGLGAAAYAVVCLVLGAHGLALRGWCKGDVFIVASIGLVLGSILVFVGFPVVTILLSAVQDNDGRLTVVGLFDKLTDSGIWGLGCVLGTGSTCGVAWNTLALAGVVGVLTTGTGLAFALIAVRTGFRYKAALRLASILPVITPPFVIGLAIILLFGRAGVVTDLLSTLFDIPRSRWIYGMPGVAMAQILAFTPISFLVLVGVLQGVSPTLEEASQTLRATPWITFRTVTLPLIRPGLANAFLISFIESLADFGNPLVLGGNFDVLSTKIFYAVVGAAHDQGRAAVLAIILLSFTLSAFLAQRRWLGRRSYTTVAGKGDAGLPSPLPPGVRIAASAVAALWTGLTVLVYGTILVGGFMKSLGRDNTLTLIHYQTAFGIETGPNGWWFSGSAWDSLFTTLGVSLVAMPLTAALGLLTAYLLVRQSFLGRGAFEFLTMLSFAIPGTVIGVSYILAFNTPPLELTGTGLILIIAFVFRNMPVGIRAGIATLSQIDKSLDEASLTLGARSFTTLRRVILPLLRPAIVTAMVYSFVRAITSVSAVIFLVTAKYNLATAYIVGRAEVGEYGLAIAYSSALIAIMVVALLAIQLLVGERRLGRRTAALPVSTSASKVNA
ncbi:iron ABC transporter permease [Azospirillum palustre]|uniref:Iron ABC transporter permease n=1 Tax=Azospirillum palustre TaxID=2044885 RepID=A0A2B8B9V0_9PROT|nr:iron ABC transporter permease [Azospirillum palustre]PGH55506.1 iron ABC transporter permease [Azospirillum palustre]